MSKLRIALDRAKRLFKNLLMGMSSVVLVLPVNAWSSEAPLQAALVYNIIKFIDWPAENPPPMLKLCVLDANKELHESLNLLNGKLANNQVIELVNLNSDRTAITEVGNCQMVFRPSLLTNTTLPHPLPKGVVLVINTQDPPDNDASIILMRNGEGKIEFEVNQAAVAHAGVKMSSQLLKLAKNAQAGKSQP